jgi:membrane protease YdiL (CAAX protease family)
LYHAAAQTPAAAAAVTAVAIGTIYAVQLVGASLGVPALAASAASHVVVFGVLLLAARRGPLVGARLGITRPRARFVIAAVLLGASVWYLSLSLVVWIDPPGKPDLLDGLVARNALVPTVVALAVLPALAEELVFRGVLLHGLATRLGSAASIVISSVVFGLYHLHPPQMIATTSLGLVVGFLTLRSLSIVPAMIVHATNNLVALALSRDEVPPVSAWIGDHPGAMLASSAAVVACGLALAVKAAA